MVEERWTVAIIEIGSTGIRMLIAEVAQKGSWKILERAGKPVSLGRDVFTTGKISSESLQGCLDVLSGFRELLNGWQITDSNIHVIATSALREATNRDIFIDRVLLKTGFSISVVEGIEENRLMYMAVRYALKNDRPQFARSNAFIIEVGGGSTEIMLLRRGKMVAAHSLRMGTILIKQQVQQVAGPQSYMRQFMREHIHNTCDSLNTELAMSHVRTFIAVGSDARIAAIRLGAELNANSWVIDRKSFLHFVESIQDYSVEECVQNLRVSFADAESLVPGLLSYRLFLEETAAEEVIVPNVSIREGLLISIASGVSPELQEEFYTQIIASALSLGRKYRFDEEHSLHVTKLALKLFDQLKIEHGMDRHARLLLEVAGILHDIGMFIRGASHHKHSQYLVANSEIFGLHREDLDIVSNVVRYHRNRPPSASHVAFIALQREDRMLVLKLSAILRVADALDRPHTQRIPDLEVERQDDIVFLRSTVKKDFSAEQLALKEKADMFQDVFGYTVYLT